MSMELFIRRSAVRELCARLRFFTVGWAGGFLLLRLAMEV